jgi:hypothetical protein
VLNLVPHIQGETQAEEDVWAKERQARQEWRRLHKKELQGFYFISNII